MDESAHSETPAQRPAWQSDPAPPSRTGNSPSTTTSSSHAQIHPRSCHSCRQRKVRCDRQHPCSNCTRLVVDCVYPAGPGRAPKRRRRLVDPLLADRLSRLESIIRGLQSQLDEAKADTELGGSLPVGEGEEPESKAAGAGSGTNNSVGGQLGRLMIDDTKSYYVSNILWANLGNEIEELRDMLHETASDDEDNGPTPSEMSASEQMGPLNSNAAVWGFRSLARSLHSCHPPLSQSVALLRIFTENVAPVVCIFHLPTMTRMYWDAISSLDSVNKNTEALLFAIYYSAAISMKTDQCMAVLGVSRETALGKYRFAVEQALARANLLNTQSIILLQAAALFLSALRNEDDSRTAWTLAALVFRIAQALGLHRDGTAFGLRPLETEIRRRLWLHICLMDNRASEYHGYEPMVRDFAFDTRAPLHINDGDLTAEMTTPPPEREGVCEMTFCMIRYEAMSSDYKVSYAPSYKCVSGRSGEGLGIKEKLAVVKELETRLQERYLRYCDTTVPFLFLCSTVARLIVARLWFAVHLPLVRKLGKESEHVDSDTRDKLFQTAITIIELSSMILTNEDIKKWSWHSETHIQWHAVAFVLSEICSRPPNPDCDRAWEFVCTVYDRWIMSESEKKGPMWRPIRRLMAKARYVREMQETDRKRSGRPRIATSDVEASWKTTGGYSSSSGPPPTSGPVGSAPVDTQKGSGPNDLQNVPGLDGLDPFLALFPDVWQSDLFGVTEDHDVSQLGLGVQDPYLA